MHAKRSLWLGNSGARPLHSIDRFCSIEQQVRVREHKRTLLGAGSASPCMLVASPAARTPRRSLAGARATAACALRLTCCVLVAAVAVCVVVWFAAASMRVTFVTLAILVCAVCVAATDLRVEGEAPGTNHKAQAASKQRQSEAAATHNSDGSNTADGSSNIHRSDRHAATTIRSRTARPATGAPFGRQDMQP